MAALVLDALLAAAKITLLVFVMMVVVDVVNVLARGRFKARVAGGPWRQYLIASFLGVTPGCLGAFANVSMYVHGNLSFGAIVAGMIATSGDESFVMLSLFPGTAVALFALLMVLGVVLGWVTDHVANRLGIRPCEDCQLDEYHPGEASSSAHYLRQHIWHHIVRVHVWRVFTWSFGALLVVHAGLQFCDLEAFLSNHMLLVLLLAALVAVVPESGPHLMFVMLFAEGLVPFSVLLTSSIVQDGHGLLPLLSYSVRDTARVKVFNLVFGIVIGAVVYGLGW